MSRNEMFLLLAGAFAAAILANGPTPMFRAPPSTVASLFAPPDLGVLLAEGGIHGLRDLPPR